LILLACSRSATNGYIIVGITAVLLFLYISMPPLLKKEKIVWLISAIFICYQLVILILRPYDEMRFSFFISYINAFLMFLITLKINWDKEKIIKFSLSYIFILIIFGFFEIIIVNPVRITGPFSFATVYAVVLVIFWAIWITNSIAENNYLKSVILTFFVFVIVLFSGTRMGLLGMALGLCLCGISKILIVNYKKAFMIKVVLGISILLCSVAIILVIWQFIPEDLLIKKSFQSILSMQLDKSNLGRVFAWIIAIDIIPQNPLWGIGPGNFEKYAKIFFQDTGIPFKAMFPHAHNIYLIILSEQGIIGFIVIGSIVFICTYKLFYRVLNNSQNSINYAILSGFIVMMFMGLFDAVPVTIETLCLGGWLMGISLRSSRLEEIKL
jgi:O-antigen ligase